MEPRRNIRLAPTARILELLIQMPYNELRAFVDGFRTGVIASSGVVDVDGVRVGPANEELTAVLAYLQTELDNVLRERDRRHGMDPRTDGSNKRTRKSP